jgi:hypothetical protein
MYYFPDPPLARFSTLYQRAESASLVPEIVCRGDQVPPAILPISNQKCLCQEMDPWELAQCKLNKLFRNASKNLIGALQAG